MHKQLETMNHFYKTNPNNVYSQKFNPFLTIGLSIWIALVANCCLKWAWTGWAVSPTEYIHKKIKKKLSIFRADSQKLL